MPGCLEIVKAQKDPAGPEITCPVSSIPPCDESAADVGHLTSTSIWSTGMTVMELRIFAER